MTSFTRTRTFTADIDAVWTALADVGTISRFHAAVPKSFSTSEATSGLGAARRCEFDPSGKKFVDETVTAFDADARTLTIDIVSGTYKPPVRDVAADIAVTDAGNGEVTVTMKLRLDGNAVQRAMAATVIKAKFAPVIDDMLAGLEVHLRTGEVITSKDDLTRLIDA